MGQKSEEFWNGYHVGLITAQEVVNSVMAKEGITEKEKEVLLEVITETQQYKQKTETVLQTAVQNTLEELMPD